MVVGRRVRRLMGAAVVLGGDRPGDQPCQEGFRCARIALLPCRIDRNSPVPGGPICNNRAAYSTNRDWLEVPMDSVDQEILDILARDARTPTSEIARLVNLSSAPVARRISRLERESVIRGYTAIIDHSRSGQLEAFTEIRLQGATDTAELSELVRNVPEVQQFFTIAGDPDALVKIVVSDVDHLQRVVNALRRTGKITGTKTLISMNSWDRRTLRSTDPAPAP
jgi:Lrp/AsnC family leucine-responsive transcriptional regulator